MVYVNVNAVLTKGYVFINEPIKKVNIMTNCRIFSFVVFSIFFLSMATVNADGLHRIPDAPPGYLVKKNVYDVEAMAKDKKFIKKAGRLYKRKCQKCHGEEGDGQGSRAEDFIIKPAAFAKSGYLGGRKDGQLFWIIENGSPDTEMAPHGLGSRTNLNDDEIWKLITFIRYKFSN